MKTITKRYPKDDIKVVWQPDLCIHSGICFSGLPAVFDPRRRPWITPEGASRDVIVAQVAKCPSGALSIEQAVAAAVPGPAPAPAALAPASPAPASPAPAEGDSDDAEVTRIEATPNGPLLVHGTLLVRASDGACAVKQGTTALCRCGGSANKPYCDGTHARIGFKG